MMLWRALLLSAAAPAAALSVSLQQERQIDPTNLASTATVPQIGEIEPWQIREFMAAQEKQLQRLRQDQEAADDDVPDFEQEETERAMAPPDEYHPTVSDADAAAARNASALRPNWDHEALVASGAASGEASGEATPEPVPAEGSGSGSGSGEG